mgnify:FL=1
MKDGYYLSTYLYINKLAYLTDIDLRHDMNMSLWYKQGNDIELIRYWELERVTGFKQHQKAFYDIDEAHEFIDDLLKQEGLTIDQIEEIWGTPELDTVEDYHSLNEYPLYCYHNICHLFATLLSDTKKFSNETILAIAVDGVPDNLIDQDIENKKYYSACISQNGKILDLYPAYSPGVHWGYIRDYFQMREGSLMALASASTSYLYNKHLQPILIDDRKNVAAAIDDIDEIINYVNALDGKDAGKIFNGFDKRFCENENKISMVAKLVQEYSQVIMDKNIENAIKNYGIKPENTYLALSGGFALNCPCNSYLLNKYKFKGFIAPPCVNDSGISMGIALYRFFQKLGSNVNFKLKNAFYGEEDNSLEYMLHRYRDYIESVKKINSDQVVSDILDNPIIWFQGKAEIGPRALGHRSLLGDPRFTKTKNSLNKIKLRQWWRPVAPIIMSEELTHWFEDASESPYMLHAFKIKKEKEKEIPAILHLDGSARVQTITRETNEELYEILREFKKRTGIPVLCNTSLNDKGEPIINTIEELINFALRKKISIAYINGVRVKFINHDKFKEKKPAKRKSVFDRIKNLDLEKELKELNPYEASEEMLRVYIQNPKLFLTRA